MSKLYRVDVVESRAVAVRYTIEADSLVEAVAKADIGETVSEEEGAMIGVMTREITDGPTEVEEDADE